MFIEQVKTIDIRFMNKMGLLAPGVPRIMSWTSRNKNIGSINYILKETDLILNYNYSDPDDEQQSVELVINIDETPCNYGGRRKWFLCPECIRRVAILCLCGKFFLCRHCYQLPYRSQQQGRATRYQYQAGKIKEQLGIENAYSIERLVYEFDRPRYMHRKRFSILKKKANNYLMGEKRHW